VNPTFSQTICFGFFSRQSFDRLFNQTLSLAGTRIGGFPLISDQKQRKGKADKGRNSGLCLLCLLT
jgi:hypothetical protein